MIYNGHFTVTGPKGHRTFRIHTAQGGKLEGKRIISLLSGSDNTSDYTGFGFVTEAGIAVWKSRKSVDGIRSLYEIYAGLLYDLLFKSGERFGTTYALLEERHCLVCNRLLTEPESIQSGIGPTCSGRGSRGRAERPSVPPASPPVVPVSPQPSQPVLSINNCPVCQVEDCTRRSCLRVMAEQNKCTKCGNNFRLCHSDAACQLLQAERVVAVNA